MNSISEGPRRIVCLTEETVELLYLLGEETRICGISVYAKRPKQAAAEKPKVTSFIKGDVEKIAALKPDLVIGFSDIQSSLAADLISAGLEVWITNQRSISEIFETMIRLGRLVGRGQSVGEMIDSWSARLEQARNRSFGRRPDGSSKRIFFQEWDEPLIGGIRWVQECLEICGATDMFTGRSSAMALARDRMLSEEQVAAFNPDAIIGSWCGKPVDYEWVRSRQLWKETNAVQKNQLFEIDSTVILQPGPALFTDGLDRLEECLQQVE